MKVYNERVEVRGTSSERTAMDTSSIGQNTLLEFRESDTGDAYYWDGDSWVQTQNSGADLVETNSGSQWAYGNWPNTQFDSGSFTGAADAATVTLTNLESYDLLTITVSTFSATALNITASIDGTIFVAVLPSKDNFSTAGAAIAATGTYLVRGKFKSIKLTQSGAGDVVCQYAHGVV